MRGKKGRGMVRSEVAGRAEGAEHPNVDILRFAVVSCQNSNIARNLVELVSNCHGNTSMERIIK